MSDKLQDTSSVSTNMTSKAALVTDLNSSYVKEDQYTHARNAVRTSKEGDLGTIGNESSNEYCFTAPYKIIGHIALPSDDILIFSTDDVSSEIGLGNAVSCTYTTLLNNRCLGFNQNFPITGVAKVDFQKGIVATFTDKLNPIRRTELKTLSKIVDCDDLLLFKKIDYPCLQVTRGQIGNMPNGMYSVAIGYVVDNKVFSDWYAITNRVPLYSETSANSLEVSLSNLDKEFDKFALLVVGTYIDPATKGVTTLAKQVGVYSTNIKSISVSDFINPTFLEIPIGTLVLQKRSWQKAGIISSNSNYLILGDLVARPEENYQLKAMGIKSEYVVTQVPANYYEIEGEDVGFYRDENYDYYIQGIYTTGELTEKFHTPGPRPTSAQSTPASSIDVYELDTQFANCEQDAKIPKWQVENTAGKPIPYNNEFVCNKRVYASGQMGVFLSTEVYPDNKAMFGDDAGTPIRYHKMPDECKVPRYSIIDGVTYINILGVRFKDIPKFDNPDIIGYKITRSDRKGGNGTVIARGLMTNVRSYYDSTFKQTIDYSNYPVNDLSPDQYLSNKQTVYKNNKEENFEPLKDYYKDKFTFYSPHTSFTPKYTLGSEVKIESEEIANITGQFQLVHNHPKQKLMNQFAFWLATSVGVIEATLTIAGHTKVNSGSSSELSVPPKKVFEASSTLEIKSYKDLLAISPGQIVAMVVNAIAALDGSVIQALNLVATALQAIVSAGLKVAYSGLAGLQAATQVMDAIRDLTGYTDYTYQYNAEAIFNSSVCVEDGNKRRRLIKQATYLPSTVVSVGGITFNNLHRERGVLFQFNKPIADPKTKDNSRQTITSAGVCNDLNQKVQSTGSAYYATSKAINPNQYGALGSSSPVSMHSCALKFENTLTTSPILYGGDCVITRFQFQKRMQFFSQNLANTNYPDGVEYDYRKYRSIAYPRYWMDSTKYDFSELLGPKVVNFSKFSRTTSSKYNLDCKKKKDGKSISRIDDAYMYLSANTGIDFFVEADYNVDFREKQLNEFPYYSKDNRNVIDIFRSDRLIQEEEFNISRAFSDLYTTEIFALQQRDDYDPLDPVPVEQPNSVIYSLPSFNLQEVDNWQYFLPANYFAFRESDFGRLTAVHKLDQDRVIFLFSKSSPFVSMGRDFLELDQSGRKVTIGDGGLFAQDPREIMPTDNNYAACNSRYAFSNTHLGRYYPSEKQGRIMNFTESLDDITRQGISYWCKNYMPIMLYKYFPTYPQIENPIAGVGYLTVFDSFTETIYLTKRDFIPKKEYIEDITYSNGSFYYRDSPILLRSEYFKDISWTLSYSPLDKSFVSWHDWHPDWVIQRDDHFLTVKDNKVYKHNESYESFCNFYGVDYPFELEFISNSGQQIQTVRSLEYILEVYHYKNFGRDRFHVHHENFDKLIVHNTEQISPLLNLQLKSNNPELDITYPTRNLTNSVMFDVLFSKEENKYRINQFWDMVKDRGEFSLAENHLFPTDESGYKQVINPLAIDINKPEELRKKFRHYWNKFRLIKTISGKNKFLAKLYNIKKLISIR